MKHEGTQRKHKWIIPVLAVILAAVVVFAGVQREEKMPWEAPGSKQPAEYTWDEFEKLEGIQKDLFYESFGSAESFEQWMAAAGGPAQSDDQEDEIPWEQGGKQPGAYSWEEYQNLTYQQKDAFFEEFESADAFDAWMEEATAPKETEPAELSQEETKQPSAEYTWEEFQALTPEEQEAFFESFESPEAFEAWLKEMQPAPETEETQSEKYPWEQDGKYPSEYTWEEFLALSPDEQEAFFLSFSNPERFEAWMNRVKPEE